MLTRMESQDFAEFKTLIIRRVNQSEMEALREEFRSYDTDIMMVISQLKRHTLPY
jgi:hypothetical protein